jgi:hypothetical protein
MGTLVAVFAFLPADIERERVAAFFAGNSQLVAGLTPLGAVRGDASASRPLVRHEVRQFVFEDALNDFIAQRFDLAIQLNFKADWVR